MMAALTILSVFGILSATEALAGFSNAGLITVAAMFVVAAGIHASGGIDLLVNKALGTPKTERQALLKIFVPVVTLSAFLNNTPVVATLIPALNVWAKKINIPTSIVDCVLLPQKPSKIMDFSNHWISKSLKFTKS